MTQVDASITNDVFKHALLGFLDDDTISKLDGNMTSGRLNTCIKNEMISRRLYIYDDYLELSTHDKMYVKRLRFKSEYNKPLDHDVLPNSITHLTFGWYYNQSFDKDVLPNSLTHLIFGGNYDQPIGKDVLPSKLTHLTFGKNYNQPINKNV